MNPIKEQLTRALTELLSLERADLTKPALLVVGCSTSEISGAQIGKSGQPNLGELVASTAIEIADSMNVAIAFQCCEHLNRALVVRREVAERFRLEEVGAVPIPNAGGSCASAAYRLIKSPVLVESIRADCGIDIGETLIGMHLKPVAVPVRLSLSEIGMARVTAARTRPRLIGGARAVYSVEGIH